jgi:hypothetical protein
LYNPTIPIFFVWYAQEELVEQRLLAKDEPLLLARIAAESVTDEFITDEFIADEKVLFCISGYFLT